LFLAMCNELKLPLFRAVKRVGRYYSAYKKYEWSGIHVLVDDFSSRMLVFDIDVPWDVKGIRYILYMSTQKWYITPSKVEPKIRKVKKYYERYKYGANVYRAIIAERWTSGAEELARSSGVPLRKFKHVKKDMVKYFSKRLSGLLASLRGKRLYGEMVFLVWLLQEILKELGALDVEPLFKDVTDVVRAVENGVDVPSDIAS